MGELIFALKDLVCFTSAVQPGAFQQPRATCLAAVLLLHTTVRKKSLSPDIKCLTLNILILLVSVHRFF